LKRREPVIKETDKNETRFLLKKGAKGIYTGHEYL
jgi:hypothetical protein